MSFFHKQGSKLRAGAGVFVNPFGDNVASPRKGLFRGENFLFRVYEVAGPSKGIGGLILFIKQGGKRLQSLFPGNGGPGSALRPEWQVDVFQYGQRLSPEDPII